MYKISERLSEQQRSPQVKRAGTLNSNDQIHEVEQENQLPNAAKIVNEEPNRKVNRLIEQQRDPTKRKATSRPASLNNTDPLRYGSENGRNSGGRLSRYLGASIPGRNNWVIINMVPTSNCPNMDPDVTVKNDRLTLTNWHPSGQDVDCNMAERLST